MLSLLATNILLKLFPTGKADIGATEEHKDAIEKDRRQDNQMTSAHELRAFFAQGESVEPLSTDAGSYVV